MLTHNHKTICLKCGTFVKVTTYTQLEDDQPCENVCVRSNGCLLNWVGRNVTNGYNTFIVCVIIRK